MIRKNGNKKGNEMRSYNALNNTINFARPRRKGNKMNNDFQKLVKHLMAKGFSKLEAKRLAQQCTTELALVKMKEGK
tara:strand:- start:190 stop:420 length:231 start_codon:yes stop_codon:yes gene_type:complete